MMIPEPVQTGPVLIFGGTFNPVHIGHLRLAIEAREMMNFRRVDFVPSAQPPHKDATGILPFDMRCALVEKAIASLPWACCNRLEGEREGPSYTYDTLQGYPAEDRYFLLGSQDYELLPKWSRGLELPGVVNLVVAPRGNFDREDFIGLTRKMWPNAVIDRERTNNLPCLGRESECFLLPSCSRIIFLPIPQLEISATKIRDSWLAGGNIEFLVTNAVLAALEEERSAICAFWRN